MIKMLWNWALAITAKVVGMARLCLWSVRAASWAVAAAASFYGVTILYGLTAGDALPPATLFALIPAVHRISEIEPYLPWILLAVAAVGTLCGWAATAQILSPSELQAHERWLIRFWSYAGFPTFAFALLFAMAGGGWSGHFASADVNYMSVGGLVPHSDARAYYSSAFELAYWHHWNWVASQRPFAAALRGLMLLAGGLSYPGTLIVQAMLAAGMMMLVLRSVVAWRGIWVGVALFAFLYGLSRPFLVTTMTEPLGLLWSLFSLAFFIEALRRRSVPFALVGFGALVCGLMTRMGSMFTIPFLMLWIPLVLAHGLASRVKIFVAVFGIMLTTMVWNLLLAHLYASPDSEIGGNLAYTACGLAHGTDWTVYRSLPPAVVSGQHPRSQCIVVCGSSSCF